MNDTEHKQMVDMLIKATQTRKLSWSWNEGTGEYSVQLGDCRVSIISELDFQMQVENLTLSLFNADGNQFDSISANSILDAAQYSDLEKLYSEVRNAYFKIRESEETIMRKLRELTAEPAPPQSDSDDIELPF